MNFTAAGISKSEAALRSPTDLALMNGVAPIFSFIALGIGSYIWLRSKSNAAGAKTRYLVTWLAIFNLPYLGLQMMAMGTASKPNGTGNDFATVFEFIGLHVEGRAAIAILGYFVFILLQIPVGKTLYVNVDFEPKMISKVYREWTTRNLLAVMFACLGVIVAAFGNHELVLGHASGMLWILSEFVTWGIAAAIFIRWNSGLGQALYQDWIIPGLLATIALVPIGFEGNDFLTF